LTKNKNVKYYMYELREVYFVPIKFVGENTEENRRKALEEAGGIDFEAPADFAEQWEPIEEDEYKDYAEGNWDKYPQDLFSD
jgi:hypothetical protein